jgi:hypothetical protein
MKTSEKHLEVIKMVEIDVKQGLLFQSFSKVKRWQQAASFFSFGYSETQVSIIMKVNVRTAHAFKYRNDKTAKAHKKVTGEILKVDIKNYFKGSEEMIQDLLENCNILIGSSTVKERKAKKDRKAELKELFKACTS